MEENVKLGELIFLLGTSKIEPALVKILLYVIIRNGLKDWKILIPDIIENIGIPKMSCYRKCNELIKREIFVPIDSKRGKFQDCIGYQLNKINLVSFLAGVSPGYSQVNNNSTKKHLS